MASVESLGSSHEKKDMLAIKVSLKFKLDHIKKTI